MDLYYFGPRHQKEPAKMGKKREDKDGDDSHKHKKKKSI
jgi:hypothetical protein